METELDFNPMVSPHREDPHLFYRVARERPVTFSRSIGAYMVSRYADVTAVLDDPRTYSSSASLPWIYDNPPEVVAELEAGGVPETTVLVNTDPPAHEHVRALTEIAFSGARVRALVHRDDDRADPLRELGAEVVVGDLTDPQDVLDAMTGADRTFFSMSVSADYLQATAIDNALGQRLPPLVRQQRPRPRTAIARFRRRWCCCGSVPARSWNGPGPAGGRSRCSGVPGRAGSRSLRVRSARDNGPSRLSARW